MQFLSQLFTFKNITYFFVVCVFNINVCVFDSLSTIRHERELSLVLTYHVTAALCAHAKDVCAQKTVYQKFKLKLLKTQDFSEIDMTIKTKQVFF